MAESKKQSEPDYVKYIGKEVTMSFPEGTFDGVLNRPNFEQNTIELKPHISYNVDQEHIYLEDKLPITIPLGRLSAESQSRPLYVPRPNGYCEAKIKLVNKRVDRNKGKGIGFDSD
jgi:hypothetical protein